MNSLILLVAIALVALVQSQECPRCIPLCQNGDGSLKTCGNDGCGGSCGTCPLGQDCCSGTCACVPNCSGRTCGEDGCGHNSCGRCSSTQTCVNGACTGTATVECLGRVCGADGAGGVCGSCPTGQRCRNGQCECYYDCADRNCGPAMQAVGTNLGLCPSTSCGTCPSGFSCGSEGRCAAEELCFVSFRIEDCLDGSDILTTCSVGWSFGNVAESQMTPPNPFQWQVPSGGYGTYSSTVSCDGYQPKSTNFVLGTETTEVTLCVDRQDIPVNVVDCATSQSLAVSSTAVITGITSTYSTTLQLSPFSSASWSVPFLGDFSFAASADGYISNTQSVSVSSTTTQVTICLNSATLLVDVRDRATDLSIEVSASISYSGVATGSFQWNGITTFDWVMSGTYTFLATPASIYTTGSETVFIDATVSMVIIYVERDRFCGDGTCDADLGENFDFCELDCVALFLEFENADGSGPVNGMLVNFFLTNPRDLNQATGPNRNSAVAVSSRETGSASNTVYQGTYSYNTLVYFEAIVTGFINFYWRADTGNIDPGLGTYRLRVHSSTVLGATNFNYRVVNTWKPIDATPEPFGPTDLNLHLFHPEGALDINNPSLIVGGFSVGRAVADSKQSGGPATMDISPGSSNLVAIWNSKPPRSRAIAPSQAGRYIVNSGSYVVIYGKTSNAATGKQLGQIVLDQLFLDNPSRQQDTVSDLWYAGTMFVNSPGQDQPTVTAVGTLKAGTITSTLDLIFDCEAYAYCAQFVVPYSDTGR